MNYSQIRAGKLDQGYTDVVFKPSFNSTQPRFDYMKEQVKRSEVPGPGSYGTRLNTQPNQSSTSPGKEGNAIFKDKTDRNGYLAAQKKAPAVAPTDYFTEQRPFLKKTFNATLPPPRFI